MAIIYELKERRVIPNWRDFKRTLQLGELNSSNVQIEPLKINMDRILADWNNDKNIGTAAEIINGSFISGERGRIEIKEAIEYINVNSEIASQTLFDLIKIISNDTGPIIDKSTSILEVDYDTVEQFNSFINNKFFHKVINRTKKRALDEMNNPIVWVELARLYSMRGHVEQAKRAMLNALYLAPHNRFVLRSSTRFFIHQGDFEEALFHLKRSSTINSDPWLVSAHIATSSVMGRYSPFLKTGKSLILSGNYSDFDLTELSSSIGTLELKEGSFKNAKSFFEQSMKAPNDNSLAQLEWASKNESRLQFNPFQYNQVINPFEAFALEQFENGQWKESFYNSIKWFLDMPFSKRPIQLGSYIAGSILQDKQSAITLCQVGLQANPNDPNLLNNIVYSIATSENFDLLDEYLPKLLSIDLNSLPNEMKITYQATLGLVAMQQGNHELGKQLYKLSIENAQRIRNEYLANLAIVNFTRELIKHNQPEKSDLLKIVENMKLDKDHKDIEIIRDDVLKMPRS